LLAEEAAAHDAQTSDIAPVHRICAILPLASVERFEVLEVQDYSAAPVFPVRVVNLRAMLGDMCGKL